MILPDPDWPPLDDPPDDPLPFKKKTLVSL